MLNENEKCQASVKYPSPVGPVAELREVAPPPPQPQPPKSNPPLMKNLSNAHANQCTAVCMKIRKKIQLFIKVNLISEIFQKEGLCPLVI